MIKKTARPAYERQEKINKWVRYLVVWIVLETSSKNKRKQTSKQEGK
jgi:hypothetical protein